MKPDTHLRLRIVHANGELPWKVGVAEREVFEGLVYLQRNSHCKPSRLAKSLRLAGRWVRKYFLAGAYCAGGLLKSWNLTRAGSGDTASIEMSPGCGVAQECVRYELVYFENFHTIPPPITKLNCPPLVLTPKFGFPV